MDHQHSSAPARAPITPAVARLHELARDDYAKGKAERATIAPALPGYSAFVTATASGWPSDLTVAAGVARRLINSDDPAVLREALRILLRAAEAEIGGTR